MRPTSTPDVAHMADARQLCSVPPADATTRALRVPGESSWSAIKIRIARSASRLTSRSDSAKALISPSTMDSPFCIGRKVCALPAKPQQATTVCMASRAAGKVWPCDSRSATEPRRTPSNSTTNAKASSRLSRAFSAVSVRISLVSSADGLRTGQTGTTGNKGDGSASSPVHSSSATASNEVPACTRSAARWPR